MNTHSNNPSAGGEESEFITMEELKQMHDLAVKFPPGAEAPLPPVHPGCRVFTSLQVIQTVERILKKDGEAVAQRFGTQLTRALCHPDEPKPGQTFEFVATIEPPTKEAA